MYVAFCLDDGRFALFFSLSLLFEREEKNFFSCRLTRATHRAHYVTVDTRIELSVVPQVELVTLEVKVKSLEQKGKKSPEQTEHFDD